MLQAARSARSAAFLIITSTLAGAAHPRVAPVDPGAHFPGRVLAAHNLARSAAGVAPLQWDPTLGSEAARYALQLAITDMFAHSSATGRKNVGENLWMGSRGAFSVNAMVGSWVSEGNEFRPGMFPAVSRTGNWRDVGHYTQVVWPATRRLGCALSANARHEYLVCRYWPAGNVHGVAVRPVAVASLARR
jgi:hypothetical protein